MDEFECPTCGSDDVRGQRDPGGTITLTCQACQATWGRSPKPSCPRCGRSDVEEYGGDDAAQGDPSPDGTPAPAIQLGGRTYRCRRCHHTWGQPRY